MSSGSYSAAWITHRFYKVVNGSGRNALDASLLNDRRQGLLGHPARLQEAREIAASTKLGNAKLDGARPCLPIPVAIAVTLSQSQAILLAIARAGFVPTSSAISFSAAKPIISRSKSASALFSTSERRFIMS